MLAEAQDLMRQQRSAGDASSSPSCDGGDESSPRQHRSSGDGTKSLMLPSTSNPAAAATMYTGGSAFAVTATSLLDDDAPHPQTASSQVPANELNALGSLLAGHSIHDLLAAYLPNELSLQALIGGQDSLMLLNAAATTAASPAAGISGNTPADTPSEAQQAASPLSTGSPAGALHRGLAQFVRQISARRRQALQQAAEKQAAVADRQLGEHAPMDIAVSEQPQNPGGSSKANPDPVDMLDEDAIASLDSSKLPTLQALLQTLGSRSQPYAIPANGPLTLPAPPAPLRQQQTQGLSSMPASSVGMMGSCNPFAPLGASMLQQQHTMQAHKSNHQVSRRLSSSSGIGPDGAASLVGSRPLPPMPAPPPPSQQQQPAAHSHVFSAFAAPGAAGALSLTDAASAFGHLTSHLTSSQQPRSSHINGTRCSSSGGTGFGDIATGAVQGAASGPGGLEMGMLGLPSAKRTSMGVGTITTGLLAPMPPLMQQSAGPAQPHRPSAPGLAPIPSPAHTPATTTSTSSSDTGGAHNIACTAAGPRASCPGGTGAHAPSQRRTSTPPQQHGGPAGKRSRDVSTEPEVQRATLPPPGSYDASKLPSPIEVRVTGLARKVDEQGRRQRTSILGVFHPSRYMAGEDCILYNGQFVSRSRFEKEGGSTTAKWYCSIKVAANNVTLGQWLTQNGMPVVKGGARQSKRMKGPSVSGEAARLGSGWDMAGSAAARRVSADGYGHHAMGGGAMSVSIQGQASSSQAAPQQQLHRHSYPGHDPMLAGSMVTSAPPSGSATVAALSSFASYPMMLQQQQQMPSPFAAEAGVPLGASGISGMRSAGLSTSGVVQDGAAVGAGWMDSVSAPLPRVSGSGLGMLGGGSGVRVSGSGLSGSGLGGPVLQTMMGAALSLQGMQR